MGLRIKTVLVLTLTVAILAASFLIVSHNVLVKGFAKVEAESAAKDCLRLVDAVNEQISQTSGKALDYAKWDDMYAYAAHPSKRFEQSTISLSSIKNLNLDFMGVFRKDGSLLSYASRSRALGKQSPLGQELVKKIGSLISKVRKPASEQKEGGLLAIGSKVLCVAFHPILRSDGTGNARGFMVMGFEYNPERISELEEVIHLDLDIYPANASQKHKGIDLAWLRQVSDQIQALADDDILRVHAQMPDLENRSPIVLAVDSPRTVYRQMLETRTWLNLSLAVSAILIFLTSIWLVDRAVVSRLVGLSRNASSIAQMGDVSQRVATHGTDEISELAQSINAMLRSIEAKTSEVLQARNAIERNERRYLQVIESTNAGIYELDRKTNRVKVNAALKRILELDADEVGISEIRERLHPDDRIDLRDVIFENLSAKTTFSLELRTLTSQGGERWVRVTGKRLEGVGEQDVVVGSVVDITTRKQAELELLKIYQLTELSDDFIGMADLQCNVTYVNPGGVAITGLDPKAQPALPSVFDYYPEFEHKRLNQEILPEVWKTGKWSGEIHFLAADRKSTILMVETIILICDPKTDQPTCIGTVARDITLQRRAEQEMAQARDAALDLARLKASFLANMSHEIRTPMNGIIGMAVLLAETPLNAEQRDYAKIIQNSAESLLSVINNILDFSKMEAGKLSIEEIPFNLRELVEESVRLLADSAHRKGIELICHVPPQLPDDCIGDPTRIRQVLMNLVGNAIKFTEQGRVLVEAKQVQEDQEVQTVRFLVEDTGIGIAPEKHASVFESFTQADASSSRKYGGTGLGLTISKQIVELLGGQIGLQSELGQGSTFWFEIPIRKAAKAVGKRQPRRFDAPYTVLVVDDDETNRLVYMENLKAWNIGCIACPSGRDAIARLSKGTESCIDAVLMDLQMPGMDGIQTAAAIREIPGCLDLPIVLVTSSGQTYGPDELSEMGLSAVLHKPIIQSQLYDLLCMILEGEGRPEGEQHMGRTGDLAGLTILLAEDNPVNRKVGIKTLERAGATVVVAENGVEAVEKWRQGTYDAVLMDCQMPVMDGFESTAEIRRLEAGRASRTPIIAMTAGTSEEDKERCRASGMDAFLTKPIRPSEVASVLNMHDVTANVSIESLTRPGGTLFDAQRLLDICDGDAEFLSQIVAEFESSTEATLKELKQRIAERDLEGVRRASHRLKGSSRNMGGAKLAGICEEMELCAKNKVDAGLDQTLKRIQEAADDLIAKLRAVRVGQVDSAA